MSVYKMTGLKIQSTDVLRQALTSLADQLKLTVGGNVRDYYGNTTKCTMSLHGTALQHGIGFTIDKDNNVNIVGDKYGQYRYDDVAESAKNYINAYQTAQKAKQQNPFAQTRITLKDKKAVLEVTIP